MQSKITITVSAGIFIVLILYFYNSLDIRTKSLIFLILYSYIIYSYNSVYKFKKIPNINNLSIFCLLFILVLIFQNRLLNYEIVSIDVPSYLVASQDISFTNLPFEKQWESKGPVFLYLYKLFLILSNNNLVIFKILNDCILFFISLIIFKTTENISKNKITAFFCALLFVSITSYEWYVTELSELYCLIFISVHYFIISKYKLTGFTIFISSLMISFSTLVNQSNAIFIIGIITTIVIYKSVKKIQLVIYMIIGFVLPQIFFILIYHLNGLSKLYLTNYIKIPFGYVNSGSFRPYELVVWLRRYFQYSEFLYYSILGILVILFLNVIRRKFISDKNLLLNLVYLILGFSIYVIAGHNYQHHLFYSIFFISIFIAHIKIKFSTITLYTLIFISVIQIISFSIQPSFNNLKSPNETLNNYPLKQLSEEIILQYEDNDFDVLAVDHVLLLFYLQKNNINYIVHPYNNFEKYIVDALLKTNLLKTNENNHLSYYIELEPEIIICAPQAIIDGSPTKLGADIFNCDIADYKKNYYKLNTEIYLKNPNREYYFDPYTSIDVFIKSS